MQGQELKQLNDRFNDEVFRKRNVNAIDQLLADDFIEHTPAPGQATDRQGAKEFMGMMMNAFPDLEYRMEMQIAEGDTVSAVGTLTGTHRETFMGVPATGKKISVQMMDTAKIRNGKFAEHWGLADMASMMAQLGVPSPM